MRFISHDPHFVRRWAMARGLVPIVARGGGIELASPGQADGAAALSWEEFAGVFTIESLALAFDGTSRPGAWSIRRGLRRAGARRHGLR